jgi:nucleoside-diphosphate-sugar epimerase
MGAETRGIVGANGMNRALVTGGGGFLGKAIVTMLRARGVEVRSLSRGEYPELKAMGVEHIPGALTDADALARAAEGCVIVFHVAAKAGVWGPYEAYHEANTVGTERVLEVCRAQGISKLVYTSTPSVTFAGEDQEGVDESAPYPDTFLTAYPETKAKAERMVLEANGEALQTVALRPHLIWGPGDNHLVPRLIDRAKKGRLRLVDGGTGLVDSVYIDNAAEAHLNAADALGPGAACAGKAYFITNGEPMAIGDLINGILNAAGLPPCTKNISGGMAYFAGATLEKIYGLLGKTDEPPMTRFVARQLATAHWFDISAARRDLGYEPKVSIAEGLERLAAHLRTEAAG